ncbi:hypothetical protein [Clostridium taeniosporum]|uniref:Uncharacterized protein n=1 Tax=Clostridium taeniosporum TaxID=394958 RepID=A0A1D7XJL3_9CLOT|nr:hypothetical protein [Clostridium taeniosporum]AOR23527.1 hypothetical protein BGI42_07175 [Clostridium taeniosporum]
MDNNKGYYDQSNNHECSSGCHKKATPLTDEYKLNATDGKSATCNNWSSVPRNYDIKEACERHEKTATNNQW